MKQLRDFEPHEIIGYKSGVNPELKSNYSCPIHASELLKFGVPKDTISSDFKYIIEMYF